MNSPVAVVGAGIAGLSLAGELQHKGHEVGVFDDARTPGGRCASLQSLAGSFDHGAARVSGVSDAFRSQIHQWCAQGLLQGSEGGFVPVPTMGALTARLAQGLHVSLGAGVAALTRTAAGWQLRLADGREVQPFGAVLLALPPRQARPLLDAAPTWAAELARVASRPAWTVCAAWPSALPWPHDTWHGDDSTGPLLHALRVDRRPGRPRVGGVGCRWVLHASPTWSEHNRDVPPAQIAQHLLAAFGRALGVALARPVHATSQLWREAEVGPALTATHGWDEALRLGACGDAWAALDGAEGMERAWLSARALAREF
jgi:predicted NAD/FAD-dependent oxidoreductase